VTLKVSGITSKATVFSVNSTTVRHTPLTEILAPIDNFSRNVSEQSIVRQIPESVSCFLEITPISCTIPVNIKDL
jgi:hypothetical protein